MSTYTQTNLEHGDKRDIMAAILMTGLLKTTSDLHNARHGVTKLIEQVYDLVDAMIDHGYGASEMPAKAVRSSTGVGPFTMDEDDD